MSNDSTQNPSLQPVNTPVTNTLGHILNEMRLKREYAIDDVKRQISSKHPIDANPHAYKTEVSEVRSVYGKESVEITLWQRIERRVITIAPSVVINVKEMPENDWEVKELPNDSASQSGDE